MAHEPSDPSTSAMPPHLGKALREAIERQWPPVWLPMVADNAYLPFAQAPDPRALFEKASNWRLKVYPTDDPDAFATIEIELHDAIAHAIYGSNLIENAGLSKAITFDMCNSILLDHEMKMIPEDHADIDGQILKKVVLPLKEQDRDLKNMPFPKILRRRNEIVQHAKAYLHIINAFVLEGKDLTEDLIKETHKILTWGIPIVDEVGPDVPPEAYGGKYRTVIVGAGSTCFSVPKFIPSHMKKMCEDLAQELHNAEKQALGFDPFSVATKYSMQFVQIHPFQDGNGRMCRMILNAIIMRYTGIVVGFGETKEERDEYIGIKRRAGEQMEEVGHGEYGTFVLQRVVSYLRERKRKSEA